MKKKQKQYLDLTNKSWKHSKTWQYVGMDVLTRPYKRWALMIAIMIAVVGILPFIPFIVTIPISIKFLGRFG